LAADESDSHKLARQALYNRARSALVSELHQHEPLAATGSLPCPESRRADDRSDEKIVIVRGALYPINNAESHADAF
jgi:hypothetical protein